MTTRETRSLRELAPLLLTRRSGDEEKLASRFLLMNRAPTRSATSRAGPYLETTMPGAVDRAQPRGGRGVEFWVTPLRLSESPPMSLLVGRDLAADVHLEDNTVSRRHALLDWHDGDLVVSDLFSRNGTYVDGRRVEPGDETVTVVRLGGQLLFGVFECALMDVKRLGDLAAFLYRQHAAAGSKTT